jgi:hypothetical protein
MESLFFRGCSQYYYALEVFRGPKMGPLEEVFRPSRRVKKRWF